MRNDMPSRQQKQEYFALNDYDLVVQFKSGNKKAGDLLIKKYAGLLLNTSVKKYKQFRSANDLEFADAEQDMFLLFFEALNDVKPRKIKNTTMSFNKTKPKDIPNSRYESFSVTNLREQVTCKMSSKFVITNLLNSSQSTSVSSGFSLTLHVFLNVLSSSFFEPPIYVRLNFSLS